MQKSNRSNSTLFSFGPCRHYSHFCDLSCLSGKCLPCSLTPDGIRCFLEEWHDIRCSATEMTKSFWVSMQLASDRLTRIQGQLATSLPGEWQMVNKISNRNGLWVRTGCTYWMEDICLDLRTIWKCVIYCSVISHILFDGGIRAGPNPAKSTTLSGSTQRISL
jgi:hypothetical protein